MPVSHQDTSPSSEEETRQGHAAKTERTGAPKTGKSLKAEQATKLGHTSDADTITLAALDDYGSLEDLAGLILGQRPELAAWVTHGFFSEGLTGMAQKVDKKLSPELGECDIFAALRTSSHKTLKDDAGNLDRIIEQCCHMAGVCGVEMGLPPLKGETDIKNLPTRRQPLQQCQQIQLDVF